MTNRQGVIGIFLCRRQILEGDTGKSGARVGRSHVPFRGQQKEMPLFFQRVKGVEVHVAARQIRDQG